MISNGMDLYISRAEIADYELIRKAIADVAAHHFKSILIFASDSSVIPENSEEYRGAIKYACEVAHSLGLQASVHFTKHSSLARATA